MAVNFECSVSNVSRTGERGMVGEKGYFFMPKRLECRVKVI
jgi:hypothetical protein